MPKRTLPTETVLKIDKDIHVDWRLEYAYIQLVFVILSKWGITVTRIEATRTRHGTHYYIFIRPAVDAETANRLQYLLGDDPRRIDFNRARIRSGLVGWNKLFEPLHRRFTKLYPFVYLD